MADQDLSPIGREVEAFLVKLVAEKKIDAPMLPEVASQVLGLSNDPDSDAAQLAKLIQSDQSLAGHVMRIANSAAYTPNASMISLQQAIARLGMTLITDIAIAASLNTKLFKAPKFTKRIAEIWSHAVSTAVWGKEVARLSQRNVEASFLCGLLHSIGRPAILQVINDVTKDLGQAIELEEALYLEEHFHVAFGEVIVQQWGMPIIVQETVQYYHQYQQDNSISEQAMIVNGAAKLASGTLLAQGTELAGLLEDIVEGKVFADLNLYEDDLAKLIQLSGQVKASMEAMRV